MCLYKWPTILRLTQAIITLGRMMFRYSRTDSKLSQCSKTNMRLAKTLGVIWLTCCSETNRIYSKIEVNCHNYGMLGGYEILKWGDSITYSGWRCTKLWIKYDVVESFKESSKLPQNCPKVEIIIINLKTAPIGVLFDFHNHSLPVSHAF